LIAPFRFPRRPPLLFRRTALVLLATLLLQCFPLDLAAQETPQEPPVEAKAEEPAARDTPNLGQSLLADEAAIWTSPFRRPKWKNVAVWGGVAVATVLLIRNDEAIYRNFTRFHDEHKWVRDLSPIATQFGEFWVPFGVAGTLCLTGLTFGDEYTTTTGSLALQAMLHSGLVIQVVKHLAGRSRPFVENGQDHWYGPEAMFHRYDNDKGFSSYDSFPSGHTITAWSLATVIASRYPHSFAIGALSYTAATLCGLSRVTEKDHWLSDVLVGAALGYAIGRLVVRNHDRRLQVMPRASSNSVALGVVYSLD